MLWNSVITILWPAFILFLGYFMEPMMELGDWRWLLLACLCLVGIALIIFAQHRGWIKTTEFPTKPLVVSGQKIFCSSGKRN